MAGTLVIDTLKTSSGVLATQNGMTGIAKAWVNFVGATGTISNSFNVSSVTRTGTGVFTIAFSTSMPSANYSVASTNGLAGGNASVAWVANNTASSVQLNTGYVNSSFIFGDAPFSSLTVFA